MEELTTDMHSEFLGEEIPRLDLYIMGVYGAMQRGLSKKDALAKYGISENVYDTNVDRVLSDS